MIRTHLFRCAHGRSPRHAHRQAHARTQVASDARAGDEVAALLEGRVTRKIVKQTVRRGRTAAGSRSIAAPAAEHAGGSVFVDPPQPDGPGPVAAGVRCQCAPAPGSRSVLVTGPGPGLPRWQAESLRAGLTQ